MITYLKFSADKQCDWWDVLNACLDDKYNQIDGISDN